MYAGQRIMSEGQTDLAGIGGYQALSVFGAGLAGREAKSENSLMTTGALAGPSALNSGTGRSGVISDLRSAVTVIVAAPSSRPAARSFPGLYIALKLSPY